MNDIDPNELAKQHLCGICKQLPKLIVVATDGHFYCRGCITAWIEEQSESSRDILSPVTEEQIEKTIVTPITIQSLIDSLVETGLVDNEYLTMWNEKSADCASETVKETRQKANDGSARHMATLARWYIFDEQVGLECDEDLAYEWSKKAAEQDDVYGKGYLGYCLIHGFGVGKDKNEGFESLVEACSEDNGMNNFVLCFFNVSIDYQLTGLLI